MTQSDKGLAKIAEGASARRHAETSPVKVKDTHLMNNKLPPRDSVWDCSCLELSWTAIGQGEAYKTNALFVWGQNSP